MKKSYPFSCAIFLCHFTFLTFSLCVSAEERNTSVFNCDLSALKTQTFSQLPYIVITESLTNSKPSPNSNESKAGFKLIPGDLIQLVSSSNEIKTISGFGCAFYQDVHGGQKLGWIKVSNLVELKGDNDSNVLALVEKLPKGEWFKKSAYRINYPGEFSAKTPEKFWLKLTLNADTAQISTNKEVSTITDNTNFKAKIINQRTLRFTELFESKPAITLSVFLLNNAIYLHAENHITETHHWGIYYP